MSGTKNIIKLADTQKQTCYKIKKRREIPWSPVADGIGECCAPIMRELILVGGPEPTVLQFEPCFCFNTV